MAKDFKHIMETAQPSGCDDDVKRVRPAMKHISEFADILSKDFDVLPLFGRTVFEQTYLQHYSLKNNKFLSCRWHTFKFAYCGREAVPFEFPTPRDHHFYNCDTKHLPRASTFRRTNVKYKMRVGPGVDEQGQLPIPNEVLMGRGFRTERKMPKQYTDEEREALLASK